MKPLTRWFLKVLAGPLIIILAAALFIPLTQPALVNALNMLCGGWLMGACLGYGEEGNEERDRGLMVIITIAFFLTYLFACIVNAGKLLMVSEVFALLVLGFFLAYLRFTRPSTLLSRQEDNIATAK